MKKQTMKKQIRVDVVQDLDRGSSRSDPATLLRLVREAIHPCKTKPCDACAAASTAGQKHDFTHHGEAETILMTEVVRPEGGVDSYTVALGKADALRKALGLLQLFSVSVSSGGTGTHFTVWALNAQEAMIKATTQRPELFKDADHEVRLRPIEQAVEAPYQRPEQTSLPGPGERRQ